MLEELGSGSFGVVNRARDIRAKNLSIATFVAVKTIPKKKISDPKTVKDEFNVLRQLDHAHICKAYECYEDRRHIYLVMDICAGGTLLECLCVQQRFPEPDAAKIMRQTLSALAYLHQANFIFRDLKTENIMFAKPVQEASQSAFEGCFPGLLDVAVVIPPSTTKLMSQNVLQTQLRKERSATSN